MPIARFEMPDGRIGRFEVPEGTSPEQAQSLIQQSLASQAQKAPAMPEPSNVGFGETGGGAATGRPMRNVQLNVQAEPRPLESVAAGATKSMFIDPALGVSKLLSGGTVGQEASQKYAQEAEPYKKASPGGFLSGQIIGSLAPAAGMMKGSSMIPSFAASPLAQNVATGVGMGLLTPEETGKTGLDFYKEQAKEGGIGATLGLVPTVASKFAQYLRPPAQTEQLKNAIQSARDVGYVIPPTQANPTMVNKAIEGISGKLSTAQNASLKNQEITNKLTAKSLGLPEDTVINADVLKGIRDTAGESYKAITGTGTIVPKETYFKTLDEIKQPFVLTQKSFPNQKPSPVLELVDSMKSPSFDANSAVEKLKQLRADADLAYRQGDKTLGKATKNVATALEDALEDHVAQIGSPELAQQFRDARQLIAKTYTVEKAANTVTGTIDAKKLASQLKSGKPLNEELKTVAEFSARFPKATQLPENMGSLPQVSPLDFATGILGASQGSPMAGGAVLARPGLRALALSNPVQNRLIQQPAGTQSELARLLMIQPANQLIGAK
jgi:hypothetical protein